MARRTLVVAVVAALGVPLVAQQAPSRADQDFRSRVQIFEAVLERAVLQGGQKLASLANASFVSAGEANAHGFPAPSGLVFDVQVPDLSPTLLFLMQNMQNMRQPLALPQVQGPTKVSGNALPTADPMTRGSSVSPDQVYTNLVKAALIDAMLDNSSPLPIKDDEYLTVAASEAAGPVGALGGQGETLILSIKGSDLAAFHQGKISKDDARQRIVEKHF